LYIPVEVAATVESYIVRDSLSVLSCCCAGRASAHGYILVIRVVDLKDQGILTLCTRHIDDKISKVMVVSPDLHEKRAGTTDVSE
ncbi:hypothetical protein KCU70_g441, partial [Aureobasidium melanogenum]